MTALRLPVGGRIDRARPIDFQWEGRTLQGFAGDTLASALLANGVRIVGRSFKLHRPRGIYACGPDEPNAVVDLEWGDRHDPNALATMVELLPGMRVRGVNAWPSVARDVFGWLDCLHDFLPAGFYYKTLMAGGWRNYENSVRALAGLGRVRQSPDPLRYEARYADCDILIVGGGAAGLAAARAAAASGLDIVLVDEHAEWGGSLAWRDARIDGGPGSAWAAATAAALATTGSARLMVRTTAFGSYDHGAFGLIEHRSSAAEGWAEERLWQVRARQVILATGAIERPLVFPDNDRPGIMGADAAYQYLRRFAVLPGRRIVVTTNNDSAYEPAAALARAGARVTIVDVRDAGSLAAPAAVDAGVEVIAGVAILGTTGARGVTGVALGSPSARSTREAVSRIDCDLVAVSGGWSPAVHLYSQSGGKVRYDAARAAFLPGPARDNQHLSGGLLGIDDLAAALESGHRAGVVAARALGREVTLAAPVADQAPVASPLKPVWRSAVRGARQWVDFQNDVTVADVELAAREHYVSVEHLKRYTTLGMAHDQGKTSNVNGLAILAERTGREIPAVGTTTFRPPYTPVSMGALAGLRRGPLYAPRHFLPLHDDHAALGAVFREYGGWMRPAAYPRAGETLDAAVQREALAVRQGVGLFDGSSLGKIEVAGPDAAAFLNLIYYNEIATLKPGRLRYCLMLRETGIVFDDGVVARLADDRFLLSPSSSHTEGVLAALELWHQTEFPAMRVAFHNVTGAWATIAVSGPRARAVLALLAPEIDAGDKALPHMSLAECRIGGVAARIARVSFTGERTYEISVPTGYAQSLWALLREVGGRFAITPYGVETLSLLRAEKGYILIGVDTDGTTLPADLGMPGPATGKPVDFVGKRSLLTPDALRGNRRQLVGLKSADPKLVLPIGAHGYVREDSGARSIGWVTSSAFSPWLGRSIALGMIEGGIDRAAKGEKVELFSEGKTFKAQVVTPCFYDPAGERLRG